GVAEQHRTGRHGRRLLGRGVLPLHGRLGRRLGPGCGAQPPGGRHRGHRPGPAGRRAAARRELLDPGLLSPARPGAGGLRARLRHRHRPHLPGRRALRRDGAGPRGPHRGGAAAHHRAARGRDRPGGDRAGGPAM
ncbi:MAG: Uncharacterized MFS-type transporter, partial [uncultured Nocardioides sp.]